MQEAVVLAESLRTVLAVIHRNAMPISWLYLFSLGLHTIDSILIPRLFTPWKVRERTARVGHGTEHALALADVVPRVTGA